MSKLTFQHEAGGWEGGTGTKHRETRGAGWWVVSWKCPRGSLSHVGESWALIQRFQRSDSQRHHRGSSVHVAFVSEMLGHLIYPRSDKLSHDAAASHRSVFQAFPQCTLIIFVVWVEQWCRAVWHPPKKHHIFLSAPVAHLDRKSIQGCMSFNFNFNFAFPLFRYRCTKTHRHVYLTTHFLLGPHSHPAEGPFSCPPCLYELHSFLPLTNTVKY